MMTDNILENIMWHAAPKKTAYGKSTLEKVPVPAGTSLIFWFFSLQIIQRRAEAIKFATQKILCPRP
jgi:hypothetical protein